MSFDQPIPVPPTPSHPLRLRTLGLVALKGVEAAGLATGMVSEADLVTPFSLASASSLKLSNCRQVAGTSIACASPRNAWRC